MKKIENNNLEVEKRQFLLTMESVEGDYGVEILLAFVRGSHMYGTATEKSDVDITFVYQQPTDEILMGNYKEQISVGGNDIVGYEIQRFINLLGQNNPNILEALDIPENCLIYKNPCMDNILNQKLWLSKLTEKTILGYADSQIKKATGLNKNMNNPQPKERKSILEFCYIIKGAESFALLDWFRDYGYDLNNTGLVKINNGKGLYALYIDYQKDSNLRGIIKDETSTQLRVSEIPKQLSDYQEPLTVWYNLDGFEVHCKQWKAYWQWVEERNEERHKTNEEHGNNYDSKNMMHLFRLLELAFHVAVDSEIKVRGQDPEWLLDIREGKIAYDELMENANFLFDIVKDMYRMSELPESPDLEMTKKLILNFRKNDIR